MNSRAELENSGNQLLGRDMPPLSRPMPRREGTGVRPRPEPAPAPVVEEEEAPPPPKPPAANDQSRKPERQLSEKMARVRSGTRAEGYPKLDGSETNRLTATLHKSVVEREKVFAAALKPPWDRQKWLEYVITTAMDEHEKIGGIPYPKDMFAGRK
jgi:hypothetical protein